MRGVPCIRAKGTCATTSQPVPACDIRLRPYRHDGSCQAALAIHRRLSRGTPRPCPLPASADTIISPVLMSWLVSFTYLLVAYTGRKQALPKQMTYNISRTVERRVKRPSTGDTFLRAWGSSSFFPASRQPHLFIMTTTVTLESYEVSTAVFRL